MFVFIRKYSSTQSATLCYYFDTNLASPPSSKPPMKWAKLGDGEVMDGSGLRGASSSSWLILMTNPVVNDRPVSLFFTMRLPRPISVQ